MRVFANQPIRKWLLYAAISLLTISCSLDTSSASISNTDWLAGNPCKLPCFGGVTPGTTNANVAKAELVRNGYASTVEQIELSGAAPGRLRWALPGSKLKSEAAYAIDTSEIVYGMWIRLPKSFTLDEYIRAKGQPSHVIALAESSPDKPNGQNQYIYTIAFVDMKSGIAFEYQQPDRNIPPYLTPDMQFDSIMIFPPSLDSFSRIYLPRNTLDARMIPWMGMKHFKEYCRLAYPDSYSVRCG